MYEEPVSLVLGKASEVTVGFRGSERAFQLARYPARYRVYIGQSLEMD
jgi:hypothetical protein